MHSTSRNRLSLFFSQFTRTRFTLIFVHIKVLLNVLSEPKDRGRARRARRRLIHGLLVIAPAARVEASGVSESARLAPEGV